MLLRAALVPPEETLEELWDATRALRSVPGVAATPREELDIPITSFGSLLPPDCDRLAHMLRRAFEGAEAPIVWFDGARSEEDSTVTLGLAGDVEPLADLARFVPEAAENMRLYVDRRQFRPRIQVATIGPESSPTLLAAALDNLAGWSGSPWAVPGLSLVRTRWLGGEKRPEEYDLIALS
ncbi:2'-5' RNA ligase family protein [Nocardioides antri]|uniref:2'-5' RNA ligase family protein n=1 Tax=Nocardioides antri TaxID=2607659 RepID=A0A5B1LZV0_9ACTN|nr:hypothetical protein [Nocardioides antri]KAA1426034.1 hypothetical protein F0U47_17010 [Nocardioides antri]